MRCDFFRAYFCYSCDQIISFQTISKTSLYSYDSKRSELKMFDTDQILKIALDMVDWYSIPADTAVHVHGKNIKKVMLI